jgi:phospholipid/cholesterol/gamma-HCH transport system substrate-binding protein
MEIRAPYVIIGLFVLAAIGAVFGFVFWLHTTAGLTARTVYLVRFENTVSGLLPGAAVLFNGIRVGEVTSLRLNPDEPRQILATIAVAPDTPVRPDTQAGLEFQGLTGVPIVALEGRSSAPADWPAGAPRVIAADPLAGQSMTQAARDALRRVDSVLAENAAPLRETIANLNTFSQALARNSGRLDAIVGGVERMVAAPAAAPPIVYDLMAPRDFPPGVKAPGGLLVVAEPTATIVFDTQKFLVRPSEAEGPSFANSKWSDNLPKLMQAKVIQSFENAGLLRSVVRPNDALTADYQLQIDIRMFQLTLAADPTADVEFSARLLGNNGKIIDARLFRASVPARATDAPAAAAALNEAFGRTAAELVAWAANAM